MRLYFLYLVIIVFILGVLVYLYIPHNFHADYSCGRYSRGDQRLIEAQLLKYYKQHETFPLDFKILLSDDLGEGQNSLIHLIKDSPIKNMCTLKGGYNGLYTDNPTLKIPGIIFYKPILRKSKQIDEFYLYIYGDKGKHFLNEQTKHLKIVDSSCYYQEGGWIDWPKKVESVQGYPCKELVSK